MATSVRLIKSSKGGDTNQQHDHFAYINEATGQGVTSFDFGHSHQVVLRQAGNPTEGAVTGTPPVAPSAPVWLFYPGPDGHTHEVEELQLELKMPKQTDDEIVHEAVTRFAAWKEGEKESYDAACEAEKFYQGDQWDDKTKASLLANDRACLVLNHTQKNVDELGGHHREMRQDLTYLPQEDGDQKVCDIANIVAKRVLNKGFFHREQSKVFEDVSVTGRGNYQIFADYSRDLRGEIKITRFPWNEVFYAPHEMEDLSDCEGLVKTKMYSKAALGQLYPDKEKDLDRGFSVDGFKIEDALIDNPKDQYEVGREIPMVVGDTEMVDVRNKEIRVIEVWTRIYIKTFVVVKVEDAFYFNAFGLSEKDAKRVATIQGLRVVPRTLPRIRITKCTSWLLLSDENPAEVPGDTFDMVPVYAHKRGNRYWGKVETVIDPQKEINKRASQFIDIGNKMVAYGWFYSEETFADKKEEKKFLRNSSKPGFTAKVTSTNNLPVQVEGTKFPSELVQMFEFGNRQLAELMNITVQPGGANTSGEAILQQQKAKLTGNEYLFDNSSFGTILLGRLLLYYIQAVYTPDRIFRLLETRDQKEPVMLGQQPLADFTEEDVAYLLSENELVTCDVEVSEVATSPTMKLATYMMMKELSANGTQVSSDVMIQLLPIPDATKAKIMQGFEQQTVSIHI